MRRENLGRIIVLMAVLALLVPVMLIADDDEEEMATPAPTDMATLDSATDSVYELINTSYQSVRPIFEKSCFDCHSSFTDFPWYHSLPLVGSMLDDHVKEGRKHLDLTGDFPFGGHGDQAEHLKDIKDEIESGDMPLWSYRLMHWGTAIEGERRDSVFAWIDESLKLLQSHGEESSEH